MRTVIISANEFFPQFLNSMNPNLEIAAVFMIAAPLYHQSATLKIGGGGYEKIIHIVPYEELKYITSIYFDYVVLAIPFYEYEEVVMKDLAALNIPKEKILPLGGFYTPYGYSFYQRWEIIKKDYEKYKILATGISYSRTSCYLPAYDAPLLMGGNSSQDLYYDYQFAKIALNLPNNNIKYALIGLAAYSFHYDISIAATEQYMIMGYYTCYHDVHHYRINVDVIDQILNLEALRSVKLDIENVDDYPPQTYPPSFNTLTRLKNYGLLKKFNEKNFPKTVEENKEILEKYIALCEEKGVIPIAVLYPVSEVAQKYFAGRTFDEFHYIIREFQKTTSLQFLNLWNLEGMSMDDFFDGLHTNLSGAKKTSAYINEYLKNFENGKNND